jgi:hypothetical protein
MVNILKYKRIKWFTDNQNAVSIIAKYSIKLELQDIALCIFKNCVQHNIFIDVEWVPRTNNDKADYISRIIDYDHWGVVYEIFVFWVPHEIDWFANDNNHNLPVFYSHYWTVNSMGIAEFTIDWHGMNGWFVPTVCLVARSEVNWLPFTSGKLSFQNLIWFKLLSVNTIQLFHEVFF